MSGNPSQIKWLKGLTLVFFVGILGPTATYWLTKLVYTTQFTHNQGITFAVAFLATQSLAMLIASIVFLPILKNVKLEINELTTRILLAFYFALGESRFWDTVVAILAQKFLFQLTSYPLALSLSFIALSIVIRFFRNPLRPLAQTEAKLTPSQLTLLQRTLTNRKLCDGIKNFIENGQPYQAQRLLLHLTHYDNRERDALFSLIANNAQPAE